MNRGLKPYTKQITQQVGNAGTINVNVNPNDANMHMTLPLVKTVGPFPIEVGLIYNHQDKDTVDSLFGKGFRLNLYSKLVDNGDTIEIENADGSTDTYKDGVVNEETQLTVTKAVIGSKVVYIVQDHAGNGKGYIGSGKAFPSSVIMASGETIEVDLESTSPAISYTYSYKVNNQDKSYVDTISFKKESNVITEVKYLHNDTTVQTVQLTYTNGRLTSLRYYHGEASTSAKNGETTISYEETSVVTLKDAVSAKYVKCTFGTSKTTITSSVGASNASSLDTSIEYGSNKSTFVDEYGNKTHFYFNRNGLLLYQVAELKDANAQLPKNYLVAETEYDPSTKRLLVASNPIWTKPQTGTALFSGDVSNFTRSGVTCTAVTVDDEIKNMVGNVYNTQSCGYLRYSIPCKVLAGEEVTVALWGKLKSTSGVVLAKLTVGDEFDRDSFTNKLDGNFEFLTLGVTAQKTVSSVDVEIELAGCISIDLGDVQVIKKKYGTVYTYDDQGNCTIVENGGKFVAARYSEKSLKISEDNTSTASNTKQYNTKNQIERTISDNEVTTETQYNSMHPNNVERITLMFTNFSSLTTSTYYDSEGRFVTRQLDPLNNETQFSHDQFGNLLSISYAENAIRKIGYKTNGLIDFIKQEPKNAIDFPSMKYTYNDKHLVSKIDVMGRSWYAFEYNADNRITKITLDGVAASEIGYDKYGNVTSQKYANGDTFLFAYNTRGQVAAVSYQAASESSARLKYTFNYNNLNRLSSITNGDSKTIRSYVYDNDGRVVEDKVPSHTEKVGSVIMVIPKSDIKKTYHNVDGVGAEQFLVDDHTIYQAYNSVQRARSINVQTAVSVFGKDNYIGSFTADNTLIKDNKSLAPSSGNPSRKFEELVPVAVLAKRTNLQYTLNVPSQTTNGSGCVQFWFKPNDITKESHLFYCKSTVDSSEIYVCLKDKKLQLTLLGSGGSATGSLQSENTIVDGWNFFALNFTNDATVNGLPVCEYQMTLNNSTKICRTQSQSMKLGTAPVFQIGNKNSYTKDFEGSLALLSISSLKYLPKEDVQRYFNLTKGIVSRKYINKSLECIDFGQTFVYTVNEDTQQNYDIYPLHDNLNSLKGNSPTRFEYLNTTKMDRDAAFNFNDKIKRYAYVADGKPLEYNFALSFTGTVFMRAYTDESLTEQYLFKGVGTNGKNFGLYVNNNVLWLSFCGTNVSTGLTFSSGDWHSIALSFQFQGYQFVVNVCLDDKFFTKNVIESSTFGSISLFVGRNNNDMFPNPLFGQLELLAVGSLFVDKTSFASLEKDLLGSSKTTEYDKIGRLSQENIRSGGQPVLSRSILYKAQPNTGEKATSYTPYYDCFTYGRSDTMFYREYETDKLGKLTKVTDETFGNHTYSYNYYGFLTNADGEEITYYSNGNIRKKGNTEFKYDSNMKDKLIAVGGKAVQYSSKDPFNPTSWDGKTFGYEGRRLVTFTKGGVTYNYLYNEKGQRIFKYSSVGSSRYVYDGDRLITELNSAYRLDFLYDENGQLFALVKDNQTKYFYVRDIFNNILGLTDETGGIVAYYDYTAYGECTVESSSVIGTQNPFRFKGYYFDTESGMYCMGSRYYVPDWCRWLNADDPAYLDFFNPSCINLFAYCGNDPIGKSYDCFGDGENSYYSMEVSSIGVSLPEIPQWMNHVSKFNDTFSSVFHSATVGYYLFKNLGFADDMLMQGVNLATALSKLPNASWLKKLGLVFSVIDAGIAIYDNLQQGNTLGRALLDGGLTFCKGMASAYVGGLVGANVGGMIGAALGSLIPIPGLGAFTGFVVGTGVGIVVSWFVDDVLGLIKDGIMDITFG